MTLTAPTSTPEGLTAAEVVRRRERDGANEVPPPRHTPAWRQLLAQLTHFFAAMLWVAAVLALAAGMASLAVAIVIIVILNGVFAFAQEHKADRAAAELNSMMPAALVYDATGRPSPSTFPTWSATTWSQPGRRPDRSRPSAQ